MDLHKNTVHLYVNQIAVFPAIFQPESMEIRWLDFDQGYLGLSTSSKIRKRRYIQRVHESIPDEEWKLIREALQREQLTRKGRFVYEVENILGRRVEVISQNRPRKKTVDEI